MMFSNQPQKKSRQGRPASGGQTGARRLYSIAAWPEQRAFAGNLSLGGTDYKFSYAPSRAEALNKLLQLTGRLTVTGARGRARALNSVRATLANTQGGLGTGPLRRQIIATEAPTGAQITSQQKQQIAGETEKQAGEKQSEQAQAKGSLPVTENTGPTSYCGVLYFHFEPLDARALGVTADLTKVQLNVRLEPLDDTARTLHGLYCYVVDALYGERADEKLAAAAISELNRVFAG
jgi:hypothetical protein